MLEERTHSALPAVAKLARPVMGCTGGDVVVYTAARVAVYELMIRIKPNACALARFTAQ